MRVRDLAAWMGATFEGDGDIELTGVAALDAASSSDLSFAAGAKAAREAADSAAGCLIVAANFVAGGRTVIRVKDPRRAFARAVVRLCPPPAPEPGVHPTAVIEPGAQVDATASIGAHCFVGRQARVGAHTVLYPRVTLYPRVEIGARCILHSGAVIGADGFGFTPTSDGWEKFPQVGNVRIEDDVEIGANSCVDRAALGITVVGCGTKLDNMVHIAHNCRLGRHVVIAAQTGLAGGVVVDDWAVIGGQVGVGDYAHIGARAVIGSGAGILSRKIVRGSEPQWGTPARPLKEYLEQLASVAKLPELRREVERLRRKIEAAEDRGPRQAG